MRNRIESARELALADKSNVNKKHRTGKSEWDVLRILRNPDTTFYCQTEEKKEKNSGWVLGRTMGRTVKIFET